MLTDRSKTYEAVLLLGQTTDTQDTTGTVLTENHEKALKLDKEQVRQVILGFKGDYDQIPPMYSALKVDGKKLCDLARAGKEVERKARRVQILDTVSYTHLDVYKRQGKKSSQRRIFHGKVCKKRTFPHGDRVRRSF